MMNKLTCYLNFCNTSENFYELYYITTCTQEFNKNKNMFAKFNIAFSSIILVKKYIKKIKSI